MALIALEGMRFYAYHGFYEEERIIGNEYIVDVHIDANTKVAEATNDLYKTINYETVYLICQAEMRKSTQLLEALVQRIVSKINNIFGRDIKGLKVRVKKVNPPLRGRIDCSFVEINTLDKSSRKGKGYGKSKGFNEPQQNNFEPAKFEMPANMMLDFEDEDEDEAIMAGIDFDGLATLLDEEDMDFGEIDMSDLEDMDDLNLDDLDLEGFEFDKL